jgi:hypothetical protein
VTISWTPCDCVAALAEPAYGHMIAHCGNSGCSETQQVNVGSLREILKDLNQRATADSHHTCVTVLLDSAWRLLAQAYEHQRTLLVPSHPSPAQVAVLSSWIQACVKTIYQAQESAIPASHGEHIVYVEKLKARLAALADAFHMYTSLLERSRSADEPTLAEAGRTQSLVEIADDERMLLTCRAATRRAIQQFITTLQVDR